METCEPTRENFWRIMLALVVIVMTLLAAVGFTAPVLELSNAEAAAGAWALGIATHMWIDVWSDTIE
jgi:hypothetical protein